MNWDNPSFFSASEFFFFFCHTLDKFMYYTIEMSFIKPDA